MEKFICFGGWCESCIPDVDAEPIDEPCCGSCGCTMDCCICQSELEAEIEREWYDYFFEQSNQRVY